jgi:hypothetical protein
MPFTPNQSALPAIRTAISGYFSSVTGGMDWTYPHALPPVGEPKGIVTIPRYSTQFSSERFNRNADLKIRVVYQGTDQVESLDTIHDWAEWILKTMHSFQHSYTPATHRGVLVRGEWIKSIVPGREVICEIPDSGQQRGDSSEQFAIAQCVVSYELPVTLSGSYC